jgi:high-affinity Fe2+/Pb2+ permease
MIFSILWWSTTLIVIFIIRPSNKTGNLSSILPKIRRLVIIVSSVSIFSGLVLYGLFSNLDVGSYIYSYSGFVILISGSLSLVVYFHVLNGGQHKFILVKNSTGMGMGRYIPFVMFGLLTITLILMMIVSITYRLS